MNTRNGQDMCKIPKNGGVCKVHKNGNRIVCKRKLLKWQNRMHDTTPHRRPRLKKRGNQSNDFFRKLERVWAARIGKAEEVDESMAMCVFHDLQLYPSRAQVHEMLKCSNKISRSTELKLSFAEFSVFASELFRLSNIGCSRRIASRIKDRSKNINGNNKNACEWEVFLGGSCNPTTWRTDTAIPALQRLGISFYNPQVSNWVPSLVKLEAEAKDSASVMLLVVERETRAVVSCIEAAHLSGYHDKLVLVLEQISPGQNILGEPISAGDLAELSWARTVIQDLLEKQDIPILSCLQDGLAVTATLVKTSQPASQIMAEFGDRVKMGYVPLGDKLIKLLDAFNSLDSNNSGLVRKSDLLYGMDISPEILNLDADEEVLNFQQFCLLLARLRSECQQGRRLWDSLLNHDSLSFPECSTVDLYVGAESAEAGWVKSVAVPLIAQAGLSYYCGGSEWGERLLPLESMAMDACRVLVWVISDSERCLGSMCLAAHYIGLGCRMVLCIQPLPEGVVILGEKVSASAVKDYNRGRVYLRDMAEREGVPIYDNIKETIQAAIHLCQR